MFINNAMLNKPKGVIIYLARSQPNDINNLQHSLESLDKYFNNKFEYPIIIFHEDFDDGTVQILRSFSNSDLNFVKVKFEIPSFLDKQEIPKEVGPYKHNIGYRHMCRFFSGPIYQLPALREYDWYWRLDTDSCIMGRINYDIFWYMERKGYVYGYNCINKEYESLVVNLWKVTNEYIQQNGIKPTFLHKFLKNGEWDRSMYYTNFEISKLDFWRSDKYMQYFNYLDRVGGIYKYRWGDGPIHTLAVAIFLPESKVHLFKDIAYKHKEWVYKPLPLAKRIYLRFKSNAEKSRLWQKTIKPICIAKRIGKEDR